MTALIVIGAVIAFFALLLLLPIGILGEYSDAGLEVYLTVVLLRFKLYPGKKKEKKEGKPKKEKKKKEPEEAKKGGGIAQFKTIIRIHGEAMKRPSRTLRVKKLHAHMTIPGDEDPAQAAINFGYSQTLIGILRPILIDRVKVKDLKLDTSIDYLLEKAEIYAKIVITATLWRLLSFARMALRIYNKDKRQEKGGDRNGKKSDL